MAGSVPEIRGPKSRIVRSTAAVLLLLLTVARTSTSNPNNKDYIPSVVDRPDLSESSLRHIMQLVSLGTGIDIPPLPLRIRDNTPKRARTGSRVMRPRMDHVIGSEFLGKRSGPEDALPPDLLNKRMGSEFLGKRMGSEFLGKRMGSEFLGKRMGSEFLGKRADTEDKRMGSEFLGKRMGSEFLGKRMGSEFLGKRMGSEFLGKRADIADKRMGSEFLGKRMGSEFLGKRMGSEFLGKRMGSEFLGKRMLPDFLVEESDSNSRSQEEDIGNGGQQFVSSVLGKNSKEEYPDKIPNSEFHERRKRSWRKKSQN